jgi:hypothetical protein
MQMTGRPSTYTDEMGDKICDLLTQGMSLRKICESDDFPNASTVYVWLDRFPSFAERYTRAREAATEDMLEDILSIADDPQIEVQDKRVRIDTRKWAMGKLKPKKYGDKQQVEVGNKDGEALEIKSTADNAALALHVAAALRIAGTKVPEQ